MNATIYAIEITLTKIDCELDFYGARLPQSSERRVVLFSHYDGSRSQQDAMKVYEQLDDVMTAKGATK
jgi:hypothetical protein